LSDDSKDQLRAQIKPLRAKEGGANDIEKLLIARFDGNQVLEAQYRQNKEDSAIATAVATAREEYRFLKAYAKETAGSQAGKQTEAQKEAAKAAEAQKKEAPQIVEIDQA